MSISKTTRDFVRKRANSQCEFCGVTEVDSGGELTIDHFQPISRNGTDSLDNLLYCCSRCNLYKLDYFPFNPTQPILWNPRIEAFSQHFIVLTDRRLQGITPVGVFTINRLRLNRNALVKYRQNKIEQEKNIHLLQKYQEFIKLQEELNNQLYFLAKEQQELLKEQQQLLKLLMKVKKL